MNTHIITILLSFFALGIEQGLVDVNEEDPQSTLNANNLDPTPEHEGDEEELEPND